MPERARQVQQAEQLRDRARLLALRLAYLVVRLGSRLIDDVPSRSRRALADDLVATSRDLLATSM